jgi:hypothetical protein
MFPFSLGVLTLLQGLYSLCWFVLLLDIGSPAFSLADLPDLNTGQVIMLVMAIATMAAVVGVIMHTVSRNLFRRQKDLWAFKVLISPAVRKRFKATASADPGLGGATMADVLNEENPDRVRHAGELMHAIDYVVMVRSPEVYRTIQVYRDQYRLARGFVLPSLALGLLLPLWEPIRTLEGGGRLGPLPLIGVQLLLLGLLFAAISFLAFRERAFRHAAARVMSYLTLAVEAASRSR